MVVKQDSLLNNMKMQAGVITNLFRSPLSQMINYNQSEIPELQFMKDGETEKPKENLEAPKEESKTEGEPKETEEKSKTNTDY